MTNKRSLKSLPSEIDRGFVVVLIICLLAIWPFLSRAGMPQATDAELHIFRLAELSRLVRAGEFYPRWAPNFYFGYGYPIFNYYAPLTYYIGLVFDILPIIGPVESVKILFSIGLLLAGFGMYGYVRELWGSAAGIVAATSYVFAPYLLFIDPHARGDLAELFSFAWFPLALWALDRLRRRPSAWNWLASVLTVAAIILTHNLMAMVLFALILGWSIWQTVIGNLKIPAIVQPNAYSRIVQFRLFIALVLSVMVTSFFWLVVALEQDAVNLGSLIGAGGHFDFRNHFLSLPELLRPSKLIDWGATQPDYALNLGITQWVLGFAGILLVTIGAARERKQAIFYVVASIVLIFFMTPLSTFVWESLPLLEFLQFPWRLLGVEATMLAILAGIASSTILNKFGEMQRSLGLAIIVGVILVFAFPILEVPPWPRDFGPTTVRRVLSEELSGRWLGTTSTADFVPVTVDIIPKPQTTVIEDINMGRPIDRVNRQTLGAGTSVDTLRISPLNTRYFVNSDQDFLLRLFLFDFPGWKVTIDGQESQTELARPEGFIAIPITSGQHEISVEFGSTPARNLAFVISLLGVILVAIITYKLLRTPPGLKWMQPSHIEPLRLSLWPTVVTVLVIFLASVLIIQPSSLLRHESVGKLVETAEHDIEVNFGNQISLIGYDLPNGASTAGQELDFTAYWKTQNDLDINYQVFVHLLDSQNNLVAQSDKLNPGEFPTKQWPTDKYIQDHHNLTLPATLEPGSYHWSIGLWVAGDGWRLPVLSKDGQQVGDSFIISETLEVK